MRKLSLDRLDSFFASIAETAALYMPVDTKTGAKYQKWAPGTALSGALNTVRSPKDFFFPQTENLMDFRTEGKKLEIVDIRQEAQDFVIFGVRACDVRAMEVLDRVFLSEPADSFYANRRAHATVFSMACTRPAETCFCGTFGINPAEPGADVSCYKTETDIFMKANTERGEEILKKTISLTEECGDAAAEEQKKLIGERMSRLPLRDLDASVFGAGKTDEFFSSPLWDTLSESCLGCGTCTFVCPTCQCYDIRDFNTGSGVQRFRCWDSCMYSDFTKMSAGQPRLTQKERFRQRFMHKLVYFPTNNDGMFSCVGCGRCVAKCPIQMNIVKVMKALGGQDK